MRGFEVFDHTADVGIVARAPTLPELFEVAAEGMFSFMIDPAMIENRAWHERKVDAGDREGLLVAWLNEILFLCEAGQLVPATFEILELTERTLVAVIGGEPFDPARHVVERTAKAVTYHQLTVEKRKGGWYARVYIDL